MKKNACFNQTIQDRAPLKSILSVDVALEFTNLVYTRMQSDSYRSRFGLLLLCPLLLTSFLRHGFKDIIATSLPVVRVKLP